MNTLKYYLSVTITIALFSSAFGFSVGACDTDELGSLPPELSVEADHSAHVIYVPSFELGGELVQEEWFDVDENPISGPEGWHRIDYIRDHRGLITEEVGYDVDGQPKTSAILGYATLVIEYDEHGRETFAGYFDAQDLPVTVNREVVDGWPEDAELVTVAFQSVETRYYDETLFERVYKNDLDELVHLELVDLLAQLDEDHESFQWCGHYAQMLLEAEGVEPGSESQFDETIPCGCSEDPEDTLPAVAPARIQDNDDLLESQGDARDEAESSPCGHIDFVEPWGPSESELHDDGSGRMGTLFVPVEKVPTLECDSEGEPSHPEVGDTEPSREGDEDCGCFHGDEPDCDSDCEVSDEAMDEYLANERAMFEDDMDCDDEENCFEDLDCGEEQESCFEDSSDDAGPVSPTEARQEVETVECGDADCERSSTRDSDKAAPRHSLGEPRERELKSEEAPNHPGEENESATETPATTSEMNPLLQPEGWQQEEDLESDAWMDEEGLEDDSWIHDDPNEPGC